MSLERPSHGGAPEPVGGPSGTQEIRPARRSSLVAVGSLACPSCDAPVLPDGPARASTPLHCGYCGHARPLREFLTLGAPTRPTRVEIHIRGHIGSRP